MKKVWPVSLIALLLGGCFSSPPTINCHTNYRGSVLYIEVARKHNPEKSGRCQAITIDYNWRAKISVKTPKGSRVSLGKQSLITKGRYGDTFPLDVRKLLLVPGFVEPHNARWGKTPKVPFTLKVNVPGGKEYSIPLKLLAKIRRGYPRKLSVSGKAGPLRMQGKRSDLTLSLTFRGRPGTTIQFLGHEVKLADKKASIITDLPTLLNAGFEGRDINLFQVPAYLRYVDGRERQDKVFLKLRPHLKQALALMKKGLLSRSLFAAQRTGRKHLYIIDESKTRDPLFPHSRYRRRVFQKVKWQQVVGLVVANHTMWRQKKCGPYKRMGYITHSMYASTYSVYDKQGKRVGHKTFRATRCPSVVLARGWSVTQTAEYSPAWKPFLRKIIRRLR